ncbi:MAG: PAS domain S-box protein [Draconibacterium sp.]|nr:PAS domain S-box protein [Draconibacterium sp.]
MSAGIIEVNNEKAILSITRDITERKKIESKLIENEEHFRTIFEQSGSGMCQTSIEGKLIAVNTALCEMLSYSRDELVGIHFNSITHPDDLMIGADAILQMKNGKTSKVVFEKRYFKKSGEIIWVHINSTLLRDESNNAKYFITQIEDITPVLRKILP